ncbi:DeoR/GlpR family DNA-binding transcription regulator [Anaerofustis sp.]|uniref:DeoR/GlpR family DNA-binding transcription regulator n=1 Tax=Anaerofustis sp. TaxID=1872517 RepID=UPI0025C236ED|nr:DeoR/GlpR family DNA-binding transcription regulator [Anaerofustis sp.]
MIQVARFEKILEIVENKGYVSVNELEKILDVSRATIYRDLRDLNVQGKVNLTRGGISKINPGNSFEMPYYQKQSYNIEEKIRIAKAALDFIKPNQTIYMDSSTTVTEMTGFMSEYKDIQVITNDIKIASRLSGAKDLQVIMTGGILRHGFFTVSGLLTEQNLDSLIMDVSFMSFDSISISGGCMITNMEEVSVKKLGVKKGMQKILLCDHSKFEKFSFTRVCDITEIDVIITGKELNDNIYKRYLDNEINVLRV